jgi:hypothetical protein
MHRVIKMGRIEFYDRPTACGLIMGDDQELYVVRGRDDAGCCPASVNGVALEPQTVTDGQRGGGGAAGSRIRVRGARGGLGRSLVVDHVGVDAGQALLVAELLGHRLGSARVSAPAQSANRSQWVSFSSSA